MDLKRLSTKQKEKLFRELRLYTTHHSNAIEGTTLSFGETKLLLENGITAKDKPLHEQLVILGFAKAFDVIVREASNPNNLLDSAFIRDLHGIMFEDALKVMSSFIAKPIGAYRIDECFIQGSSAMLCPASKVSQELENLLYLYDKKRMTILDIAKFHIKFELIHPFSDGNGRIGRLIIIFQAIQNNLVPPTILYERRDDYLDSFESEDSMSNFLNKAILETKKLISQEEDI